MISGDARQFLPQIAVMPTHRDLFGREAALEDLVTLVKKYPIFEWLSYLARAQHMLGADQVLSKQRIQRVICGTMPHALRKNFQHSFAQRRFSETMKFLARRLGLDATKAVMPPTENSECP